MMELRDRKELEVLSQEELIEHIDMLWKLTDSHMDLLRLIPECPVHGACIPHAKDWVKTVLEHWPLSRDATTLIAGAKARSEEKSKLLAGAEYCRTGWIREQERSKELRETNRILTRALNSIPWWAKWVVRK